MRVQLAYAGIDEEMEQQNQSAKYGWLFLIAKLVSSRATSEGSVEMTDLLLFVFAMAL